ncbi:MAG: universal stress protein [Paracoccaceae bacterium]
MVMTSGIKSSGFAEDRKTAKAQALWGSAPAHKSCVGFTSILACVDGSPTSIDVLAWASLLSRSLNASLRTLHVLDPPTTQGVPPDPLAWELRRREAQSHIEALVEHAGIGDINDSMLEVAIGPFHDQLQARLAEGLVDLCVIGAVGESTQTGGVIGQTTRRIVETSPCSVLIIPPRGLDVRGAAAVTVQRVMVPLDCSRRAETALPAAVALAGTFGAEIVMTHAVPEPAITEIGPPDEADIALSRNVTERNRRVAERYMSRLRARLALERRPIRTLIVGGTEPRHQLVRAAQDEGADLIVVSAKGAGGYADQALGSVADFLLTHLGKPLLIVRAGPDRRPATPAERLSAEPAEKPTHNRA